jgi:protein SCO1
VTTLYRIGIRVVLATLFLAAVFCLVAVNRAAPSVPRAAHDLGTAAPELGTFRIEERSGRIVTESDLADRVGIASFIFTRCPLSCPRISGVMKGLQGELAGTKVLLLSVSVDPEHDTPAVLSEYANRFGAMPDRWWFLTGPQATIHDLIRDRLKLTLTEGAPADPETGTEAIVHSDRLALLDRGRVVGYFDSNDPKDVEVLVAKARRLALPVWVLILPTVNASLNALSAALLLAGWVMIRRYRWATANPVDGGDPSPSIWDHSLVKAHIACMVSAVCTSAVFLVCYLVYHYFAGSYPFPQGGFLRVLYLSILLSHTLLATGSVPLIIITVLRGWRGDLGGHTRFATVTFPIWMYVAVTGVVIYLMLYHLPILGSVSGNPS